MTGVRDVTYEVRLRGVEDQDIDVFFDHVVYEPDLRAGDPAADDSVQWIQVVRRHRVPDKSG